MAESDSPRTKSWDISLEISGSNQGNFFLESVTFQFHARMLSSEVAHSLKSYGDFSDSGVGITLSHRHAFFEWSKYIHPRPRRGRQPNVYIITHRDGIGVMSQISQRAQYKSALYWASVGPPSATLAQHRLMMYCACWDSSTSADEFSVKTEINRERFSGKLCSSLADVHVPQYYCSCENCYTNISSWLLCSIWPQWCSKLLRYTGQISPW